MGFLGIGITYSTPRVNRVDTLPGGHYNGAMPADRDLAESLRAFVRAAGADLFGIADITSVRDGFLLERETRDRFDRALSLGKQLSAGVLDDLRDGPTALYMHHYRQVNLLLDRAALLTAGFIQDHGYRALPIAASQIIDWDNQKAHVPHKKVGELAGLGWLGRSNLLVHPEFGSQFRLVTILTDAPLAAAAPLEMDCGPCRRCISVCPAQAIKDTRDEFEHRACFEKLKEFRRMGLVGQSICGLCLKACPGTPKPKPRH
jgi:epoxyqueuosine reductase